MIKRIKPRIPESCYAYDGISRCKILTELSCAKCSFFRTEKQHLDELEACNALLRAKPKEEQARIAKTYYCGKMPWLESEEEEV